MAGRTRRCRPCRPGGRARRCRRRRRRPHDGHRRRGPVPALGAIWSTATAATSSGRAWAGKTSSSGIGTGYGAVVDHPSRPAPARWRWAACTPSCCVSSRRCTRRNVTLGLIEQSPARLSVHVYRLVWPQTILFAHTVVTYGGPRFAGAASNCAAGYQARRWCTSRARSNRHHRCPGVAADPAGPARCRRHRRHRRHRRYRRYPQHRQPPAARSLRGQSRRSHHRQSGLRATS